VLRKGLVICHAVEGGRVELGEGGMCILAVQAFLEAIDPGMSAWAEEGRREART